MSKVFVALAVSVDGYITGRDPGPGRGLGDGGALFDWYFRGDTPSQGFDGFALSEPSSRIFRGRAHRQPRPRIFDAPAGRAGASLCGRNTFEDSESFGGGSPHPTAPLVV